MYIKNQKSHIFICRMILLIGFKNTWKNYIIKKLIFRLLLNLFFKGENALILWYNYNYSSFKLHDWVFD